MAQRQTEYTGPATAPLSEISPPASPPPPSDNDSELAESDSASLPVDHIDSEAQTLRTWIASFAHLEHFTIAVSRDRFLAQTAASRSEFEFKRPAGEAYGPVWWLLAVDTFQKVIRRASVPVAELAGTADFLGLLAPAEEGKTVKTDEWPAAEQLVVQCGSADNRFAWPIDADQPPVHFKGVSRLAIALSTDYAFVQTSDFAQGLISWTRDFTAASAVANTLAELQFRNVDTRVADEFNTSLALDPSWGRCKIEDILPLQQQEEGEQGETPLTGRVHVTFRICGAA